jgi:Tfp pilus assembly protein PilO
MANGALDRHKPLFLLVGSLAAASLLLYAAVLAPKIRAIDGLKAEAAARQERASSSLRQWEEMPRGKDEKARAWETAVARFDERIPSRPEQERFMAEVVALVVRRQLREFRLSVSDGMDAASAVGAAQGPAASAPAPGGTPGEGGTPESGPSFTEIRYRLVFSSAYRDLADFLDELPRLKRLVAIRSVTIREKEGKTETALEISIFHRGTP